MPSGWVGVCLSVCVQGFTQDFVFWEGGNPKFGVDVEGLHSTYQPEGSGGILPQIFFFFLIDAPRLIMGVLVS